MAIDVTRRKMMAGLGIAAVGAGYITWDRLARAAVPAGVALDVARAFELTRAKEILLIDIRRPDEWSRTGIPEGAHPLDMRRRDFTEALRKIATASPNRPIALICARGVRSARMARKLAGAGFTDIQDVPEGMLGSAAGPGWLARGLPVVAYVAGT